MLLLHDIEKLSSTSVFSFSLLQATNYIGLTYSSALPALPGNVLLLGHYISVWEDFLKYLKMSGDFDLPFVATGGLEKKKLKLGKRWRIVVGIFLTLPSQYRLKSYHFWLFLITMVTILRNF